MNRMAKWICIIAGYKLTLNKVYDGYIVDINLKEQAGVRLINDSGGESTYYKHRFISLEDWREQQIKTVLDE